MTIKSQAKWFMGIPAIAIVFWSVIALMLFGIAPDRSKNPACNVPKSEWSDTAADECAGDLVGYTTAGVLILDVVSVGLFFAGTVVVLGSSGFKLVKKSQKA